MSMCTDYLLIAFCVLVTSHHERTLATVAFTQPTTNIILQYILLSLQEQKPVEL